VQFGGILEGQDLFLRVIRSLQRLVEFHHALLSPKLLVHAVSGDLVKPHGEPLRIGERVDLANDRQPRVLKQLVGEVHIVHKPAYEAAKRPLVSLDQLCQGLPVPELAACDEHLLNEFGIRSYHRRSI